MAVHIKIPQPWDISEHRLTPEALYWNRRQVLRALGLTGTGMAGVLAGCKSNQEVEQQLQQQARHCRSSRPHVMTILVWIDLSQRKKSLRATTVSSARAAIRSDFSNRTGVMTTGFLIHRKPGATMPGWS